MEKRTAAERLRDSLQSFEENYPGCRLDGAEKKDLNGYVQTQIWLCFSLWSKDEAVAEYIYKECGAPDGLLRRMGGDALLLCAATVYGLKKDIPEAVPSRETREQALESVERGVPFFDRLRELSGECGLDRSAEHGEIYYRKLCRDILTMPERTPVAAETLIETLRDKTERFFQNYYAEFRRRAPELSRQAAFDYVDLAYPVLCAVREGDLEVAEFVTFGMAPNRDPFMAVGDFWIKSAAAAVVGVAKGSDDRYDWPETMLGLIDYYVAYGGEEDTRWHRGEGSWYSIPGMWSYEHGIDKDFALSGEWWHTAYYNVMYRLNGFLNFDYLEQIWYQDGLNSLGEIWMKKGFPGGETRVMRVGPSKPEEDMEGKERADRAKEGHDESSQ